MITFTKEQLIASAHARIEFAEMMLAGELEPLKERTWSIELALARIALASLEAEPYGYVHKAAYEQAGSCGLSSDHEAYRDSLSHIAVYTAPPSQVSVPDYPETLPCPVFLEPGLRFGKGVHTRTMLGALRRRAEYYAELEAMTPDERAEHDAGMKEFAAMLQGAEPVNNHDELREKVRREHAEWSQATFGDVGPVGPLKHLSKEALEAAAEPGDLSEWADMQFLLWDAQRRAGISDGEITAAMEEKLKVNIARQWPEPKDGEPRLHIKEDSNSPAIPDGWVACSERMPEEDTYNVVADIGSEGNIYCAAAAWFIHGNFSPMDGVSASNYDGGASIEIDMHISHWMPLKPLQIK